MVDRASISILVADDHPMFRLGLSMALRSLGFGRVDEAFDGGNAIHQASNCAYDVLVLDLRMPVANGLQVVEALQSRGSVPITIILTTYEEPAVIQAAKDLGVDAFLGKETEPERLGHIVDRLVAGFTIATNKVIEKLPKLSDRELEVLRALALGRSLKGVGVELDISVETVKDHVARLYAKLGVRDRVSAVREARAYGWLLLDELGSQGT